MYMLTNMKKELKESYKKKQAIPQFNINNLEWTKFILEECQKENTPVILGVSDSAIEYMGGYNTVTNLVKSLIKDYRSYQSLAGRAWPRTGFQGLRSPFCSSKSFRSWAASSGVSSPG